MNSLTDEHETNNQDLSESGAVVKPPPAATDFAHITTRYLIAARQWTRANREQALDALKHAVVAWRGVFWITLWRWRGHHPLTGSADRPGHGEEHQTTIELYGKWLANGSRGTFAKGQAVSTTMARSRFLGHSDDECVLRSGLLLDSDECGGWDSGRYLYRDLDLSFVGQIRPITPNRCHFELPIWPPLVPERDETGLVNWKRSWYRPRLGWVLGILSELAQLRYEPAWDSDGNASAKYAGFDPCCDQLTHLCHVYTRRPEDPEDHFPITDWNVAGALDLHALVTATDFEAASQPLELAGSSASRGTETVPFVAPSVRRGLTAGMEEIEPRRISAVELLVRLRRLRNPDSQTLINRLLAGEVYAPIGQRDIEMHRAASIIAALAPNEDPVELAKLLFTKSLEAMAKVPGADPAVKPYVMRAAKKIDRAQQRLGGGRR